MPTITIRLDDLTRAELDTTASASGLGVSELIRRLIDQALGRHVRWREGNAPTSLTPTDRLVLAQNERLLAAATAVTDPNASTQHERNAEILHNGWTAEYPIVFGNLREEMDISQNRLVWDLLDMFRVLEASRNELLDADLDRLGTLAHNTEFDGLDLADPVEGPMLHYLEYLIATERWTEISDRLEVIGDHGNSHSRQLPRYQAMLEVFQPIYKAAIREGRHRALLTVDEIRRVASA